MLLRTMGELEAYCTFEAIMESEPFVLRRMYRRGLGFFKQW